MGGDGPKDPKKGDANDGKWLLYRNSGAAWQGIGIVDDINSTSEALGKKDYVSLALNATGLAAGVAAAYIDPLQALTSWGLGWLMEHFRPLTHLLDKATGDWHRLAAYSDTWKSVSDSMKSTRDYFINSLREVSSWKDYPGYMYELRTSNIVKACDGAVASASIVSTLAEHASKLVKVLHDTVRDLISDCVAAFISGALVTIATAGVGSPYLIAKATSISVEWAGKIGRKIDDVIKIFEGIRQQYDAISGPLGNFAAMIKVLKATNEVATAPDAPTN